MAALSGNTIIADGTYAVTTFPGMLYVLGLSGSFGTGTPGAAILTLKWVDDSGNATTIQEFNSAGIMTFRAPSNSVQLVLAGATDPVLVVSMPPVHGTGLGSAALADLGTGADQVPVTGDYVQLQYRTMCCVGTSISKGGSVLSDAGGTRVNLLSTYPTAWLPALLGQKVKMLGRTDGAPTFGYDGATILDLLTDASATIGGVGPTFPVADALATDADVFILEGGANDIPGASAATVIQRITNYWTYFTSRGRNVIAINCLPTDAANLAARGAKIVEINAALPAIAASLGVTLVDVCSLSGSDGSTAVSEAWIVNDGLGVHPTTPYAYRIASAIAAAIRPYTTALVSPQLAGRGDARWLTQNPSPCGVALPTGWSQWAMSPANVWSTPNADADGTKWQRFTGVVGGAAPATGVNIYGILAVGGYSSGDKFRATAKVRLVSGTVGAMVLMGQHNSANGNTDVRAMFAGGNPAVANPIPVGEELYFLSDILTVPFDSGSTSISWSFTIYDATGPVVFDIRECGLIEVVDDRDINPNVSGAKVVGPIASPVLDFPTLPATDHSAVGPQTNDIASGVTTMAIGQCCYLGATKWLLAKADAEATTKGLLAIALEAKADTVKMNVALPGSIIRDDTWAWTIGGTIYLSDATAGAITQTAPTAGGSKVRVLGYALTADSMYFNPSNEWTTV